MKNEKTSNRLNAPNRSLPVWRIVQVIAWLAGIGMVFSLIFFPALGLLLVWNILIPVAPALLVIATGVWRNICPLAFTFQLPRRFGFSKNIKLSGNTMAGLNLAGLILLLFIVPLRHLILNGNGMATAVVLIAVGVFTLLMGLFFKSKSGWCSGLCPVHQVEKLYGSKVLLSATNAHCLTCNKCTIPCPDSTPGIHPLASQKSVYSQIAGHIIIGGFPGYIWGWFQVPDYSGTNGFLHLDMIYGYPLGAMFLSLLIYWTIMNLLPFIKKETLIQLFAATAISCYYWFRLPNLFGFGHFPQDGILVDLNGIVPTFLVLVSKIFLAVFFFWFLVFRNEKKRSWLIRPKYAGEFNPAE